MEPRQLPYLDEHSLLVGAPRETVWAELQSYVADSLTGPSRPGLAPLLGTRPPSGFEVAESLPGERVTLAGRHRFARYRLVFTLDDGPDGGTVLRATSWAAFPGPHGRVYRALVVGTRGHVVATRHLLGAVRRRAEGPQVAPPS